MEGGDLAPSWDLPIKANYACMFNMLLINMGLVGLQVLIEQGPNPIQLFNSDAIIMQPQGKGTKVPFPST